MEKVMNITSLEKLLNHQFFLDLCQKETHKPWILKSINIFCFDCGESMCSSCVTFHQSHPHLQVLRYTDGETPIVKFEVLKKVIDCSLVKPYYMHGGDVVFLNRRPKSNNPGSRAPGSGYNSCRHCGWNIPEKQFHFCSIRCKVIRGCERDGKSDEYNFT
ncbi:protein RGF1 INDUCIBLE TRANSCRIPTION FACTOR 1-like isoform X2 [Tasmannia lanceolata]|uniref:protein RGF1 INDUCIBLE TRANSCRIPTION FACTOR 1-like isoform X2 n=1 Tax=Tasmannia lanceolata TaxID=3420 RepID=UPI004062851D